MEAENLWLCWSMTGCGRAAAVDARMAHKVGPGHDLEVQQPPSRSHRCGCTVVHAHKAARGALVLEETQDFLGLKTMCFILRADTQSQSCPCITFAGNKERCVLLFASWRRPRPPCPPAHWQIQ